MLRRSPRSRKPRVVVAGQLPPPLSGQHFAVQTLLRSLQADPRFDVEHLPYGFSPTMEGQGSLNLGKALELVRIAGRFVRTRGRGPIDIVIHPIGGTSTGSTLRDVAVVMIAGLTSRQTVLHFHGAGHGRIWPKSRSPLVRLARPVLGRADAAIVQAQANAVDPEYLGIRRVFVAPYLIEDTFDPALVDRDGDEIRILYVGHIGPHRGTPNLLEAVRRIAPDEPGLRLLLVGSAVGEYTADHLRADVVRLGVEQHVELVGTAAGRAKDALFGRAHVFAFPTMFDAESFGLVQAEALMWGMPVVATDWRANSEVLSGTDSIVHRYEPDLTGEIERALRDALGRFRSGQWPRFSARNRAAFERRYKLGTRPSGAVDAIATLAGLDDPGAQ